MTTAKKMAADCKPVTGKVPGPREHQLCAKHGHILNVKTKEIIAENLAAYKKDHAAKEAAEKKKRAAAEAAAKKEDAAEEEAIIKKMAGSNPEKMKPDCKLSKPTWARQAVAVPARIQLCKTHGHVVDTKTKLVVAKTFGIFNNSWTKMNLM